MVVTILLCIAIILLAALAPKPVGWVALALAVLALLFALLGQPIVFK